MTGAEKNSDFYWVMRRVEPAFPDLIPVTHMMRPGFVPAGKPTLDPLRMGVVWPDAPHRTLPRTSNVPKTPIKALAFASVAAIRLETFGALLEAGSAVLLVMDNDQVTPDMLGVTPEDRVVPLIPLLPPFLEPNPNLKPGTWSGYRWGALLGIFPFPGCKERLRNLVETLAQEGASYIVAAPLLLTPKDRRRILDGFEELPIYDELENRLFHADLTLELMALEKVVAATAKNLGVEQAITTLVPQNRHPQAVRTAALLRLWARRLDQSHEESSRGWRLRRVASALETLRTDPIALAAEDNLKVVPGVDSWVRAFLLAIWFGGEALEEAWKAWVSSSRVNIEPNT